VHKLPEKISEKGPEKIEVEQNVRSEKPTKASKPAEIMIDLDESPEQMIP
jgi:hypothetical protein